MKYYLLPLLIAALSLFITVTPDYVLGSGGEYAAPQKDGAQHLAGAYAYLDGDWQLPLFFTDRINHPHGANIIFTDSAPLAAVVAKGVHSLTGLRFNYLGMWFVVLWLGQAIAAAYLMRQLGIRHPLFVAAGCTLALLFPPFLYRHGHLALSSHFLLLFALGLYVRGVRQGISVRWCSFWAVLLAAAVWVHAYLFVMAYVIFIASVWDTLRRHCSLAHGAVSLLLVSLPALILAILGGYLSRPPMMAEGYHFFSMNLLAPIWPGGAGLFGGELLDPTGGQYEGYNYLGLGVIGLLLGAVVLEWRRLLPLAHRCAGLLVLLFGLFCYSLSHHIWVGDRSLVQLPLQLDFFPFSTFRAAGRFFWPVAYALLFASLYLLMRRSTARSFQFTAVFIAIALVVQLADASRLYRSMRAHIRHELRFDPEMDTFRQLVGAYERVRVVPANNCWSRASENDIIQMTLIAAREGVPINVAHVARAEISAECGAERRMDKLEELDEDVLYVALLRDAMLTTLDDSLFPSCRFIGHRFAVCSQAAQWPDETAVPLEAVTLPACPAQYDLTDSRDHFSRWFDGFGAQEAWGRWTVGGEAHLACLAETSGTLTVSAMGYGVSSEPQQVIVQVNDATPFTASFPRDELTRFVIPVESSGALHLQLRIRHPVSPEALGEAPDNRELGIKLIHFSLTPLPELEDE